MAKWNLPRCKDWVALQLSELFAQPGNSIDVVHRLEGISVTMVLILAGNSLSSAHGRYNGTITRKEFVLLNPSFD